MAARGGGGEEQALEERSQAKLDTHSGREVGWDAEEMEGRKRDFRVQTFLQTKQKKNVNKKKKRVKKEKVL